MRVAGLRDMSVAGLHALRAVCRPYLPLGLLEKDRGEAICSWQSGENLETSWVENWVCA